MGESSGRPPFSGDIVESWPRPGNEGSRRDDQDPEGLVTTGSEKITMDDTQRLAENWKDRLRAAGLTNPEFLSATYSPAHFGNAEVDFRAGLMILRLVRDRGQEFLSVAFDPIPDQFYPIEDIEIAMGWATIEEVNARQEPEQLGLVLSRFAQRFDQLMEGMSGDPGCLTRARIEKAKKDRGQAFVERLRKMQR